eukprot:14564998-Ditylum_brightwellii.AAC.1
MCFNAAKPWQLGWDTNQTLTLDVTARSYHGPLSGIVDYLSPNMNPVLIQLNQLNSAMDYYITFNVKKRVQ